MDYRSFTDVIVEKHKILDYLLSPIHPHGKYKAAFFGRLGYHQLTWRSLERDIRGLLDSGLRMAGETRHGIKFTARGKIIGPNGHSAHILTVWIAQHDHNVLRFVTAYPEGAGNEH
jgi:hypothetical protein